MVRSTCALLLLLHGRKCKQGCIRVCYVMPVGTLAATCKIISERMSPNVISFFLFHFSLFCARAFSFPLNKLPSLSYKYSLFPRCVIAVLSIFSMLYVVVRRANGRSSSDVLYISALSASTMRPIFPRNKSSLSGMRSAVHNIRKELPAIYL